MTSAATQTDDRIELTIPLGRAWVPVVRLVLGGIADRIDLGLDDLDDVQLAIERLLAEAAASDEARLAFEIGSGGLRALVGPLREDPIAEALQGPEPRPGELTLRRILETVVDAFGVERADGGQLVVRLEKAGRAA